MDSSKGFPVPGASPVQVFYDVTLCDSKGKVIHSLEHVTVLKVSAMMEVMSKDQVVTIKQS